MTIQTYSLGELKKRIRNEFKLEDEPTILEKIKDKINEAYLWICRSRRNWPWMLTEDVLDTFDSTEVTLSFTQKSKTAVLVSGSVSLRDILTPSNSELGLVGYLVKGVEGAIITLNRAWRGETGDHTVSIAQGYLELPEDFLSIQHGSHVSDKLGNRLTYLDSHRFFHIQNRTVLPSIRDSIYTVVGDPVNQTGSRYLAVFPYLTESSSILYTYSRMPQSLEHDTDIPILPLVDRPCLLYSSLWLVGQSLGIESSLEYRNMALDDLRRMSEHMDEDETVEFRENDGPNPLDMSSTRNLSNNFDSDYNPSIL